MYQRLTDRLRETLAAHILKQYGLELAIVLERPPKIEMGEAASPVCFELAKQLKRAPRQIAQEIANGLGSIDGIARVAVAGGGYLNAYFDRAGFWESAQAEAARLQTADLHGPKPRLPVGDDAAPEGTPHKEATPRDSIGRGKEEGGQGRQSHKIIVEHTSINPNKAAHIGHVRNAVLGDTMVRILRHTGNRVQIQNYIDNTGVQVADVVIGLLQMEKVTPVWARRRG